MRNSPLSRGRVRASYFDIQIAARRLEMVAAMPEESGTALAAELRLYAEKLRSIASLLSARIDAKDRADLERALGT